MNKTKIVMLIVMGLLAVIPTETLAAFGGSRGFGGARMPVRTTPSKMSTPSKTIKPSTTPKYTPAIKPVKASPSISIRRRGDFGIGSHTSFFSPSNLLLWYFVFGAANNNNNSHNVTNYPSVFTKVTPEATVTNKIDKIMGAGAFWGESVNTNAEDFVVEFDNASSPSDKTNTNASKALIYKICIAVALVLAGIVGLAIFFVRD
jgi:hypothetical protein